jgi:hypothetical protein
MSSLRDEIRMILREEIANLRTEMSLSRAPERVQISSNADLNRFAADLLGRAARDPDFAAAVTSGAQGFELTGGLPAHTASLYAGHQPSSPANSFSPRIVTGPATAPARTKAAELVKNLVTERDIEALDAGATVLRVPKHSRLTPLANDEARRRGIRIERFAS